MHQIGLHSHLGLPMQIHPAIKSRNVNYMNRPLKSPLPNSSNSSYIPRKQQRLLNIEKVEPDEEISKYENNVSDEYEGNFEMENFIKYYEEFEEN